MTADHSRVQPVKSMADFRGAAYAFSHFRSLTLPEREPLPWWKFWIKAAEFKRADLGGTS